MDTINSQKEYSFFNVSYWVSFISVEPVKSVSLPVNVVLQLEPSSLITQADLEIARSMAIKRLVDNLGEENSEKLSNSCELISACLNSISFLGQGTEEAFSAKAK